eukprot:6196245-Pleurochrysis_carterae.AAC.1
MWSNVAALLAAAAVGGATFRSTKANPTSLPHARTPASSLHKGAVPSSSSFGRAFPAGVASEGRSRKAQSGNSSGGGGSDRFLHCDECEPTDHAE